MVGELSRMIRAQQLIERSNYNPVLVKGVKQTLKQRVRVWLRGKRRTYTFY
jgi:hydroxymethylpyrimidine/phosphomethylpyrimidine kinase